MLYIIRTGAVRPAGFEDLLEFVELASGDLLPLRSERFRSFLIYSKVIMIITIAWLSSAT